MKLVVIESPFAPSNGYTVEENLAYLRAAMAHCLARGEAPYASHALYTDLGHTFGMPAAWSRTWPAVNIALSIGQPVEYRTLPGWPR